MRLSLWSLTNQDLLADFAALVKRDCATTAELLVYMGRAELYVWAGAFGIGYRSS